ncbi:MAG: M23 family metallopeptidase [Blastocatellia bacterium]|nr:M23 family metallopeptidase [Blastocatellia bacterium]
MNLTHMISFPFRFLLALGLCSCFLLLQGSWHGGLQAHTAAAPIGITLNPIRAEWPVSREASGFWVVVGDAIVTNPDRTPVTISKIQFEVLNASGKVLKSTVYKKKDFKEMLLVVHREPNGGFSVRPSGTRSLETNESALILVTGLTKPTETPTKARMVVNLAPNGPKIVEVPLQPFSTPQPMRFPLAFDGKTWLNVNAPLNYNHRFALLPTENQVYCSQRFAIDFLQVDEQNRSSVPAFSLQKEDYFAWGKEIRAVAPGRVVAVERELSDQEIGGRDANHPAGNFVVIQHGEKLFSVYAHMMNHSPLVNPGELVVAGQMLGKVGNSGNTSEPHLHVHFVDAWDNSPLSVFSSQGLPTVLSGGHVVRGKETLPLVNALPLPGDKIIP